MFFPHLNSDATLKRSCLWLAFLLISAPFNVRGNANINWSLAGSAQLQANDAVLLTPHLNGQDGGMWDPCTIDVTQNFDLTFSINLGADACGADGITFMLQNSGPTQAGGNAGEEGGSIPNSLGVHFDTFSNNASNGGATYDDPPYDSLNITTGTNNVNAGPLSCGGTGVVSGPTGCFRPAISSSQFDIKDGLWHTAEIKWDAVSLALNVYVDGDPTPRATWVLPSGYVASIFNANKMVYFGFVGATGGSANVQQAALIGGTVNGAVDVNSNPCVFAATPVVATPTPYVVPTNPCGTPTNMPSFTASPTNTPYQSPTNTLTPFPPGCGTPTYVMGGVPFTGQCGKNLGSQSTSINIPPTGSPMMLLDITRSNWTGSTAISSITYNGIAFTLAHTSATTPFGTEEFIYYAVLGGSTGSAYPLVINFSPTSDNSQWAVQYQVYGGVDPVTPLGAYVELSVGSSRVDLQACKLEYSIVSPK